MNTPEKTLHELLEATSTSFDEQDITAVYFDRVEASDELEAINSAEIATGIRL